MENQHGVRSERAKIDALTEGVAAGPEAAGHGCVDVEVRAVPIFLREGASTKERDADGGKIAGRDDARLDDGTNARVGNRAIFDDKTRGRLKLKLGAERQDADAGGGFHAGKSFYLLEDLQQLEAALFRGVLPLHACHFVVGVGGNAGDGNVQGEQVVRAEARAHVEQIVEAAQKQSGADE